MLVPSLPDQVKACLFDLDGILTDTASVHARAWKGMFDAFLKRRAEAEGGSFEEFDIQADYLQHVDGKPRDDGVRDFLASRGIELPEGDEEDPEDETIRGLGKRKNDRFHEIVREDGVETFDGSVRFVEIVREAGYRCAVVSSSKNTTDVLEVTGLRHLFEVQVDGLVAVERGLPGKPEPDTYLYAAEQLGFEASACAVFEDAVSGVRAGKNGAFGWVVGVDRVGQAEALRENGADVVVNDLSELLEER